MQLDKLVNFYKALADRNRIRIIILLSNREYNGQMLADKLGVTPGTITHHITKLKAAGLIVERREKNISYYGISHYLLEQSECALSSLIKMHTQDKIDVQQDKTEKNEKYRESVLKNFLTNDGRIKQIPSQLKKKLIVLEYLVANIDVGKRYSEKEVNEYIKEYHNDFATIRREFIMHHYMYRENEVYELNPRELWEKWENL